MDTEHLLERLAADEGDVVSERAPARLKSRLYSTLLARLAESGPLRPLDESRSSGARLCVFEAALTRLPGDQIRSMNPCRVCHARILGERVEHAPIFWPGCPYSDFARGRR
jgi:hypothetical protein